MMPGVSDGQPVPRYRDEPGVEPKSMTETFVAAKVEIDNWRWAGVPFYLRTGKRLAERACEIVVHFKEIPALDFFRCSIKIPWPINWYSVCSRMKACA